LSLIQYQAASTDIYVQRWLAGVEFKEFNPGETNVTDAAEIIASAYGLWVDQLSAYFLTVPVTIRRWMRSMRSGVSTPFDKDGDLLRQ